MGEFWYIEDDENLMDEILDIKKCLKRVMFTKEVFSSHSDMMLYVHQHTDEEHLLRLQTEVEPLIKNKLKETWKPGRCMGVCRYHVVE